MRLNKGLAKSKLDEIYKEQEMMINLLRSCIEMLIKIQPKVSDDLTIRYFEKEIPMKSDIKRFLKAIAYCIDDDDATRDIKERIKDLK